MKLEYSLIIILRKHEIGLKSTIIDYLRLKFCVVCVGNLLH